MAVKKSKALEKADKYIRQNKLKPAIDELLRYAQSNPDDVNLVNVYNKIGDLFAQMGNRESAIEYFQKSVDYYITEGFLTKAIAILKKILRMDDGNVRALEQLADVYIQEGLHHEAKRQYLAIAEKYRKDGLTKRALESYRKIVDMDPDNVQSRLKLAELFVTEGLQQEAVEQMISLSKTLREKGDLDGAEKVLMQTRKLEIPDPAIDLNLARIMMLKGNLDGAEQVLNRAAGTFTRNPMIMEMLGSIKMERKDYDGAQKVLLQVFQMDSTRDKALHELMAKELENGRITKAWKAILPVVELNMRNEEFTTAGDILREFSEAAPHFAPALQKLVILHEKTGEKVFLIASLEKLANAYKMDGNITGAEKAFKQLSQLDPMNYDYKSALQDLGSSFAAEDMDEARSADLESVESIDSGEVLKAEPPKPVIEDMDLEDAKTRQKGTVAEAEMYIEYGLKKKAYRLLEGLLSENPFDIKANKMFSRMCMDKGEIAKASKSLLNVAEAYIRKQEFAKAETYLDKSDKMLPGSSTYLRKMMSNARDTSESFEESDVMLNLDNLELSAQPTASDESVEIDPSDVSGFAIADGESESVAEEMLFGESVAEEDSISLDLSADETDLELDIADEAGFQTVDVAAEQPFDTSRLSADSADHATEDLSGTHELELDLSDDDSVILEPGSMEDSAIPDLQDMELDLGEPRPRPEPAAPKESADLSDEIQEIDFYLSQNMFNEARDMLQTLELDHPGHPELTRLRRELDAAQMVAGESVAGDDTELESAIEDQFLDLQAEFGADMDMFADNTELTDKQAKEQLKSVDELFQEFKQGVEEQIDKEDFETHYNLGIAYKEMGLAHEAVEEFAKASHDDHRYLDCCFMIATVYEEIGEIDRAIEWLDSGATRARESDRDEKPLLYEAGRVLHDTGHPDRARPYFEKVHKMAPDFRDVAARLGS